MQIGVTELDLFEKGFAEQIVKKMDPEMKISKDAEILIGKVAMDFAEKVSLLACELAELRGSQTIERNDIKDAVKQRFNLEMPGAVDMTAPRNPSRDYLDMLAAATRHADKD